MISFIPILWYFTEISTFHENINQSILFSKAYRFIPIAIHVDVIFEYVGEDYL